MEDEKESLILWAGWTCHLCAWSSRHVAKELKSRHLQLHDITRTRDGLLNKYAALDDLTSHGMKYHRILREQINKYSTVAIITFCS
jgi:hypothetical protein